MKNLNSSIRNALAAVALVTAFGFLLAPSASAQNQVQDLLDQVDHTVNNAVGGVGQILGDGGAAPAPAPAPVAGVPPDYQPPAHGANPHGQGTVATVDLVPEDVVPLSGDPAEAEDVIVGRARGEKSGGEFAGHITIVSLFGAEVLGVETGEGETEAGPLDPIQTGLLDALCDGSGNQVCLEVLTADSATTEDGSTNDFAVARAGLLGPTGVNVAAAESSGSISESGDCQTSTGTSNVADAALLGAISADAVQSSSTSQACADGTESQNNASTVIGLNEMGLGIPAPGCADGTPDSNFTPLAPLLSAVCNADDSNGVGESSAQDGAPYGVREALTAFVLDIGAAPLVKATTGASESAAVAPRDNDRDDDGIPNGDDNCPNTPNPDQQDSDGDGRGDACDGSGGGGDNDKDDDGIPNGDGDGDGSDQDNDGILDDDDNCPTIPNPDQADADGDGIGDVCEGSGLGDGGNGDDANRGDGQLAFSGADLTAMGLTGLLALVLGIGLFAASDRRRRASQS